MNEVVHWRGGLKNVQDIALDVTRVDGGWSRHDIDLSITTSPMLVNLLYQKPRGTSDLLMTDSRSARVVFNVHEWRVPGPKQWVLHVLSPLPK
jgi:hypothetical protein